jgi:hypothetical protein
MSATPTERGDGPEDQFFALRSRAYELADTGRYKEWTQVADALLAEGFPVSIIKRLDEDGLAVLLVTRACRIHKVAAPSPASRIRKWFG